MSEFHFLRPEWLWLIVPAVLLLWLMHRRDDPRRPWRGLIAPHLLESLLVHPASRWRIKPVHVVSLTAVLAAIGIAGPTWQREPTPFTEDTAPLVIAIDLSEEMNAIDIQPTRLERAKQKIRDLLNLRRGSRTALLAYAGGAYRILPLTDDPDLLELFLASLSTSLMPSQGRNTVQALHLAQESLAKETAPGTVLFVACGIERAAFPEFRKYSQDSGNQVLMLAVGTSQGGPIGIGGRRVRMDVETLKAFGSDTGAQVTSVTLEDDDVAWIAKRIQSHLIAARDQNANARWKDFGYYLVIPVALIAALWFRKGWTVRWAAAVLPALFLSDAQAADFHFIDLWLTKDQQGRYYFDKGDYTTAAQRFEDPLWRGIAAYRAGHYPDALTAFAMVDSPEGAFWVGNSYAELKKYPDAVAAYDRALKSRPDFSEAVFNRRLVQSLIPKKKDDEEEGEIPPDLKPDEVKFDDKGKKGKEVKMPAMSADPAKMAEIWMRSIEVTPAQFLRQKFLIQERQRK